MDDTADDAMFDDLFNLDTWEEVQTEGWLHVLADGRIRVFSVPDEGIAVTGAGGSAGGIVTILTGDIAELATFLEHLATTGQPPMRS